MGNVASLLLDTYSELTLPADRCRPSANATPTPLNERRQQPAPRPRGKILGNRRVGGEISQNQVGRRTVHLDTHFGRAPDENDTR